MTSDITATGPQTLLQMMTGYWRTQSLHSVCKLGIPDILGDESVPFEEIAAKTGTHASSLYRVLRALASVGVFSETEPGRFHLTSLGHLLRTDREDSMHSLAIMYAEEQYKAWADLLHSVRTGTPAFDHLYGMPVFQYFAENSEAARIFNAAMIGYTNSLAAAVVGGYDFSRFGRVVDVGGGHGALLAAILRACPGTHGVLFELPAVAESAATFIEAAGIGDRCQRVGGDFFVDVPAGGDAYVLEQILHDWDDDRCRAILQTVRRTMRTDARIIVVELVLPGGDEDFFGKWLDLHMLVMAPGGRERTLAEYEALFKSAGFALSTVIQTQTVSVIEAEPV